MEPKKVFVKEDGTTVVKCPSCYHARTVSVEKFKEKKKIIKIKCSCKKSYFVSLELRKMYRKSTNLKGSYLNCSLDNEIGMMIVKDVSMGGIGFEAVGGNRIEKDHELEVTFTLDDTHSSVIKKNVVVRIVNNNYVGCEFTHAHEYNKALGFYLLP
ncbi:PilZ domain-containing protein [Thermodesulfobacteriota bacterium]